MSSEFRILLLVNASQGVLLTDIGFIIRRFYLWPLVKIRMGMQFTYINFYDAFFCRFLPDVFLHGLFLPQSGLE